MGSIWTTRTRLLLVAAALLLVFKLGQEVYRWAVFGEERDSLRRLSVVLESTALNVMRTQLVADSLHRAIYLLDEHLEAERSALASFGHRARRGDLSTLAYDRYRELLDAFNRKVAARNESYERWKGVVDNNHRSVEGYNLLVDSIRSIGRAIGEPYISIPSPAEVAVRHGLDTMTAFTTRPDIERRN